MTINRLYIFCEGQTEETFSNLLLYPYFFEAFGVSVTPLLLPNKKGATARTNKGGWADYARAKTFISGIMSQLHSDETWFTTMLDLYAIPSNFPGLANAALATALQRIQSLEESFKNDIITDQLWRFSPHLQLHEFEALLFTDLNEIRHAFPERTTGVDDLANEIAGLSPEDVDEGPATAPSKRIIKYVPEYNGQKPAAGPSIANRIGLTRIRATCPHFDSWLSELETQIDESAE